MNEKEVSMNTTVKINHKGTDKTYQKTLKGTGAITLVPQESGEILVYSIGKYNEFDAVNLCLNYVARAYDKQEDTYTRELMSRAMDEIVNQAKAIAEAMNSQNPLE